MRSRLTALALVALALAPVGAAAAVLDTGGPAPLAATAAVPPAPPAQPEPLMPGLLGEGGLTTYSYVPASELGALDLGALFETRRAFANLPASGHNVPGFAVTTYSVVAAGGDTQDLVSPIPAAAVLFGSALGGLGALAWRQRHRGRPLGRAALRAGDRAGRPC